MAFQHCLSELLHPKFRNDANDRTEAQLAGIMSPRQRKQGQGKRENMLSVGNGSKGKNGRKHQDGKVGTGLTCSSE